MTTYENEVLKVQMLGGFSMFWKGRNITSGTKTSETQFLYLMQLILHNRKTGIAREKLEEVLFEGREISDPHHALQAIIYNAKKRLQKEGLPDVKYFELRKGVFYWTEEIPVWEDAEEFERLFHLAEQETDLEEQLGLYLDACYLYKGEFLPAQAAVTWSGAESQKYRGWFCRCMEQALPLLRLHQNFMQMEALGRHASRISPLSDWETVTMEALVSQGRYDDAQRFYSDTVEYYIQELGVRPSKKLMEILQQLGSQIEHQYAQLDTIQRELEEKQDAQGGYLCSYPVFQGIYHMVKRMMERGGQSVQLMLCTIVDRHGRPVEDGEQLDAMSQRLGDAVCHSVRHGDAICRYRRGQFLLLLVNATRENCGIIQKRINYNFVSGHQRTGLQYYINTVLCGADAVSLDDDTSASTSA